jgi:cytochrome d ubiquinol oxidase subunit II
MADLDLFLPVIWTSIIAIAVAMYVILDGFDLGVGILFPTTGSERSRDAMMTSVAPFWDGNETWLVLGGGGLFAAFPGAYSVIMPGLYIPVILMLLSLILRGVSFEFRWSAKPKQQAWDFAFAFGSIFAAFSQGLVLGGFLQGIKVEDGVFVGGMFDWFSAFSVMCGVGLVAGYGLLGSCWLLIRTSGEIQHHARRVAPYFLAAVTVFIGLVSIWTPLRDAYIWDRWFSIPNIFFLWPLPLATAALIFLVWRAIVRGSEAPPFIGVVAIFLLCFLGLAISAFPYMVPPSIDLWQAAAVTSSLTIMLIGVSLMLPLIIIYTFFVYWTFRGKVSEGESYH